jgi:EAL domain-containing protein (putative c-di-GMP-specific phosphodiesterase class I)
MLDFDHILEVNVVAEGVEQEHQMKTVKEYGCRKRFTTTPT